MNRNKFSILVRRNWIKDDYIVSVLYFALFSGWLLSIPFQGQVLSARMTDLNYVPPTVFTYLIIAAHFTGLISGGFLVRSFNAARRLTITALYICMAGTIILLIPTPFLYSPVMVITAVLAGFVISCWGYYFQKFTAPGSKLKTAATIIIISNIIMIVLNTIAVNVSAVIAILISIIFIVLAIYICTTHKLPVELTDKNFGFDPKAQKIRSLRNFTEYPKNKEPIASLRSALVLLYLFVSLITINSGLMYQVVIPSFSHHQLLTSIYWALPYIGTIYMMTRISEHINKSYIMYIAVTMIGFAYILFFSLNDSALSYVIIDTLLLGACGICDLFWWTILGEMLTFTNNPVKIFGVGLSANIFGILIGVFIGESLFSIESAGINPTTIAVCIVLITLIALPILYNRLAAVIDNNTFLFGLSNFVIDMTIASEVKGKHKNKMPGREEAVISSLKLSGLTEREIEIAQHLLNGESYRMIAQDLNISENTVKSHIKNIYSKTHVKNKSELIKRKKMV